MQIFHVSSCFIIISLIYNFHRNSLAINSLNNFKIFHFLFHQNVKCNCMKQQKTEFTCFKKQKLLTLQPQKGTRK